MDDLQKIRLVRKFNCKHPITYSTHLLLLLRFQIVYESLIIITNCLANLSLHFHFSHVYTASFWTSEHVASSNFGLALTSFLIIPYTLVVEQVKNIAMVRDLQATPIVLHAILCILYSRGCSLGYLIYVAAVTLLSMGLSSFLARIN